MTKTWGGAGLLALAALLGFYNMLDTLADIRNWHGEWNPGIVIPAVKAFLAPMIAALGGTLMPTPGKD